MSAVVATGQEEPAAQSPGPRPGPADLPVGTALRGRYRIDAVLARGGTSTVHLAHDLLLDRDVAVKVFGAEPTGTGHVLQPEARVVAALSHPALTAVYDAGLCPLDTGGEVGFLVLERVAGGDLRGFLARGRLSWPDVASVGIDLADGLAHMHAAGYLHRDVKPGNVLVVGRDGHGRLRAKITDFGIASRAPDRGADVLGTAAYISPEQVRGAAASERSDVYALGLVLLEALTGVVEFPGPAEQSAYARLHRDAEIPAGIPRALAALLRAMTHPVPRRRPAAAEVADRLAAAGAAARTTPSPRTVRAPAPDGADLLAWPPERAFDAATALAARLLQTPHACVALGRTGPVRLTSAIGLAGAIATASAAPWLADPVEEPWTIPDLLADPRSAGDPFVQRTGVRSFAGAPLLDETGEAHGVLCVFDDEARAFDSAALDDLAELAALVVRELALRVAVRRAVFAR